MQRDTQNDVIKLRVEREARSEDFTRALRPLPGKGNYNHSMTLTKCSCNMLLKSQPSFLGILNPTSSQWICLACRSKSQWQYRNAFSTGLPAKTTDPTAPPKTKPVPQEKSSVLPPLNHLIGVDEPPKLGQNPAKDPRPWSERRNAYWERSAHSERRRKMYGPLHFFQRRIAL